MNLILEFYACLAVVILQTAVLVRHLRGFIILFPSYHMILSKSLFLHYHYIEISI